MNGKEERQRLILSLITSREIGTQEELTKSLSEAGITVTQATLSRDLREMRITKVAGKNGQSFYAPFRESSDALKKKYIHVLQDGYISMDNAGNLLVIRTVSGMAMAVAAALDKMDFPEIVGSIAGDDTVMCALKTNDETLAVMERIGKILRSSDL